MTTKGKRLGAETKLAGSLNKYGFDQADNVWSVDGICPTIITGGNQIGHQINILEEDGDETDSGI